MVFVDIPSFATDHRIKDFDVKLLVFLIGNMNESNEVRLLQDELADALKVGQPSISKALGRLREARYIATPRIGIINISAEVAWRASLAENEKVVGLR